jgi:hypothetical protein
MKVFDIKGHFATAYFTLSMVQMWVGGFGVDNFSFTGSATHEHHMSLFMVNPNNGVI